MNEFLVVLYHRQWDPALFEGVSLIHPPASSAGNSHQSLLLDQSMGPQGDVAVNKDI